MKGGDGQQSKQARGWVEMGGCARWGERWGERGQGLGVNRQGRGGDKRQGCVGVVWERGNVGRDVVLVVAPKDGWWGRWTSDRAR